jgi:peroxiredoxin
MSYPIMSVIRVAKVRDLVKSTQFALCFLLICSALMNILQAYKMGRLEAAIAHVKGESKLREGDSVPAITATDMNGSAVTLDYKGENLPRVLYVFKPSCTWCTRNLPNVKTLADNTRNKYQFIGLSLSRDKLQDYVASHGFNFPIYSDLSQAIIGAYKLGGTPETIVISPEGQVLKRWLGAYNGAIQRQIEEFFNVNLPGFAEQTEGTPGKKDCDECDEQTPSQSKARS